jgi:hypothetical protein
MICRSLCCWYGLVAIDCFAPGDFGFQAIDSLIDGFLGPRTGGDNKDESEDSKQLASHKVLLLNTVLPGAQSSTTSSATPVEI